MGENVDCGFKQRLKIHHISGQANMTHWNLFSTAMASKIPNSHTAVPHCFPFPLSSISYCLMERRSIDGQKSHSEVLLQFAGTAIMAGQLVQIWLIGECIGPWVWDPHSLRRTKRVISWWILIFWDLRIRCYMEKCCIDSQLVLFQDSTPKWFLTRATFSSHLFNRTKP